MMVYLSIYCRAHCSSAPSWPAVTSLESSPRKASLGRVGLVCHGTVRGLVPLEPCLPGDRGGVGGVPVGLGGGEGGGVEEQVHLP